MARSLSDRYRGNFAATVKVRKWPVAALAPVHVKGKLAFLATAATVNSPT